MNGKKLWFSSLSTFFFSVNKFINVYMILFGIVYTVEMEQLVSVCYIQLFTTKLLLRYEGASWSTEQIQEQAGRAKQSNAVWICCSFN